MSEPVNVSSTVAFRSALKALKNTTHGDTLAVYLAFKWNQERFPRIGEGMEGVPSRELEKFVDDFYTKQGRGLGPDNGKVCAVFSGRFRPRSSHGQNNWRDFFRYGNGISCLAPEEEFTPDFLGQSRATCSHLIQNSAGDFACSLHHKQTKYIRGLNKPKFLKWTNPGPQGDYKLTPLDEPRLLEVIRPLTSGVPLEPLIQALYFGAAWNRKATTTVEDFATDFHFSGADLVEYLFATNVEDPGLRRQVDDVKQTIYEKLRHQFELIEPIRTTITTTERRIRDRAFSDAVRKEYDYSCAVCNLKASTPEGYWEVQAAHICQQSVGGAEDIRNGIAFCHNHHWFFDQKLFTVSATWELVWHPSVVDNRIRREGLLHRPVNPDVWPAPAALQWHRESERSLRPTASGSPSTRQQRRRRQRRNKPSTS